MGKLENKSAIVTGGSHGIGGAISEELLVAGCNLAVHYFTDVINHEHLTDIANKHQRKITFLQADLTSEKEAIQCINSAHDFLGGIDVLVNNTGGLIGRRDIEHIDRKFWQTVFDVNLTSMMYVTREVTKYMGNEGASIINISSVAGRRGGHPGSIAYAAQKGAMLSWTRALAMELAPSGIRVNAVTPGFILGTRFHATFTTEESARETVAAIPLGRAGNSADIARAVCFLASEFDGFITGATIDVNGGVYMI